MLERGDVTKGTVEYRGEKVAGMSPADLGGVLYNRGMFNAVIVAEAIAAAQKATGKKAITGADMRIGLESFDLSEARLAELGLAGFTAPIKGDCADHEGAGSVFMQQWNGKSWDKISDPIAPITDVVAPLLQAAADQYVSDKPEWQTQSCN